MVTILVTSTARSKVTPKPRRSPQLVGSRKKTAKLVSVMRTPGNSTALFYGEMR